MLLPVLFLVPPVITASVVIEFAPEVPITWAGTHGDGVHGTFTARDQTCEDSGWLTSRWTDSCVVDGLFYAAGETIGIDTQLTTHADIDVASEVSVVMPRQDGRDVKSVFIDGSREWLRPLSWLAGGVGIGAAWLAWMVRAVPELRRRATVRPRHAR